MKWALKLPYVSMVDRTPLNLPGGMKPLPDGPREIDLPPPSPRMEFAGHKTLRLASPVDVVMGEDDVAMGPEDVVLMSSEEVTTAGDVVMTMS